MGKLIYKVKPRLLFEHEGIIAGKGRRYRDTEISVLLLLSTEGLWTFRWIDSWINERTQVLDCAG